MGPPTMMPTTMMSIAGIEIEETENGVFVLSSDSVDDNEEESSELSDTNVSYDFKTEVTVE